MRHTNPWSFFRPHIQTPQPVPTHISPDTAQIIRALQRGQRSQIQPMPPPRSLKRSR